MLEISDISFSYPEKPKLVNGLTVSVPAGALCLVQGASGCGKSTLLSVVSGSVPDGLEWSGDIRLNGRSVSELPAETRAIGILFQDPMLFPHLTVGDNLAFGLKRRDGLRTRRERQTAISDALASAGLDGFGDRDPATLSGGQAARVGLMRALLAEPDALLMDEAFSALDPALRQQFAAFVVAEISQRNIPALLVSHDEGDATFASGDVIRL